MYDYLDRFKLCYHGTTSNHAHHIVDAGIDVTKGYKAVDFGQGFYTTSSFEQAKKHAQKLWKDTKNHSISPAVVRLEVDVINLKKSNKITNFLAEYLKLPMTTFIILCIIVVKKASMTVFIMSMILWPVH